MGLETNSGPQSEAASSAEESIMGENKFYTMRLDEETSRLIGDVERKLNEANGLLRELTELVQASIDKGMKTEPTSI